MPFKPYAPQAFSLSDVARVIINDKPADQASFNNKRDKQAPKCLAVSLNNINQVIKYRNTCDASDIKQYELASCMAAANIPTKLLDIYLIQNEVNEDVDTLSCNRHQDLIEVMDGVNATDSEAAEMLGKRAEVLALDFHPHTNVSLLNFDAHNGHRKLHKQAPRHHPDIGYIDFLRDSVTHFDNLIIEIISPKLDLLCPLRFRKGKINYSHNKAFRCHTTLSNEERHQLGEMKRQASSMREYIQLSQPILALRELKVLHDFYYNLNIRLAAIEYDAETALFCNITPLRMMMVSWSKSSSVFCPLPYYASKQIAQDMLLNIRSPLSIKRLRAYSTVYPKGQLTHGYEKTLENEAAIECITEKKHFIKNTASLPPLAHNKDKRYAPSKHIASRFAKKAPQNANRKIAKLQK